MQWAGLLILLYQIVPYREFQHQDIKWSFGLEVEELFF